MARNGHNQKIHGWMQQMLHLVDIDNFIPPQPGLSTVADNANTALGSRIFSPFFHDVS
jgi:hypothetical protein